MGAFQVQGALAIDDHSSSAGVHKNVSSLRRRHKFHLVAQAVTSAARDCDPEKTPLPFTGNQTPNLAARFGGQTNQVLITFANSLRQWWSPRGPQ